MRIEGTITAMITPFKADGMVDLKGLKNNVRDQIAAGVNFLLVLGTTGEAPTLSDLEQDEVIAATVDASEGSIPVIAGCGTNSTFTTLERVKRATELGVAAVQVVTPYYNRPTQEGLFRHFSDVAEASEVPIMLYDIPKRTGSIFTTETLEKLFLHNNIVSLKDCSGEINHFQDILTASKKTPQVTILAGDDPLTLPLMALGAHGIVSVISNLVPEHVVALTRAMQQGDIISAREIHDKLLPIARAAFVETSPAPIKAMMALSGLASGPCRQPLCPLTHYGEQIIRNAIECLTLTAGTR